MHLCRFEKLHSRADEFLLSPRPRNFWLLRLWDFRLPAVATRQISIGSRSQRVLPQASCCPSCRPVSATAWCSRLWRHWRMHLALLAFKWTKCECWRFKVHSRTQCFWARWKTKITVFVCALNILLYDCALINHLFYINFVRWLNKKLFYLVNCAPARAYENSCQPIIKSGRGHAYPAGWSVC